MAGLIALEFGTGYAAARSGRRADAASALERLGRARQSLDGALPEGSADNSAPLARAWARILEAQLSLIESIDGDGAAAVAALRDAALIEERLAYEFGPPVIDKPSHELLGELLLSQNRPIEARAAFEKALARAPERTGSLRGLLRAAVTSGDTSKAEEIRDRLRAIWRLADQIPEEIR